MIGNKISQNNISSQILSSKNNENNTAPSFKGLQTSMQRGIYNSPETLQKLMGIHKWNDGIVGTIPGEMIKELLADGATHHNMPNLIRIITSGISDATKELRKAEILGAEVSSSFDVADFANKIAQLNAKQDLEGINKLNNSLFRMGALSDEKMRDIEQGAEKILAQTFKKVGLLTQDGSVSVRRLGNGMFGNAFKLSFQDAKGEKMFHDKVLKVFKDSETEEVAIKNIAKKSFDFYNKMTLEEYVEYSNKMAMDVLETMKKNNVFGEEVDMDMLVEGLKQNRPLYEAAYNIQKNMSLDDCINIYREQLKQMGKFHGVNAEANRSMFLKRIGGNMMASDYVPQHFYDLKNRYAFVDMADGELPQVKRKIDLDKYGLTHGDVEFNTANTVNGRIIDVGGIASKAELAKPQKLTSKQQEMANMFEKAMEEVQQNYDKLSI